MPLNITHSFSSVIPDNPLDLALGKVTPSRWNDAHTVTGNLLGNEVINTPAGIVTATDVQAAINQLAAAIPAPGPGTDPLSLIHGLSVQTVNPTFGGNATDRYSAKITVNTDCSESDPLFGNTQAIEFSLFAANGQCTNGPKTQAKQSFFATNSGVECYGSGQKFVQGNNMRAWSMGDAAIHAGDNVVFAGGPVNGDEGVGWGTVSSLSQLTNIQAVTIVSLPAQSLVNTTTTQQIFKSKSAQTVSVVNTAGAIVGDWVVIEQELPSASPNLEAVQIISFTANSITGIFLYNHNIGVTVTPALRMIVDNVLTMGQDRVIVNMSAAPYNTGTVSSIVGGAFVGALTNWTVNMVGGNATNVGVISLAADDQTGGVFGAQTLRSWYQIGVITDPTTLAIYKTTVAGAGDYVGKGPGAGTYTIRPCAKLLRFGQSGGSITAELICETSTSTWTVGDSIECVICPYPDVTGFQYHLATYTNGGTYRGFMFIRNNGYRAFESAINISDSVSNFDPNADGRAFDTQMSLGARSNSAIEIRHTTNAAIQLLTPSNSGDAPTDLGSSIVWDFPSSMLIGPNTTNEALQIFTTVGNLTEGKLIFAAPGKGINTNATTAEMSWGGYIYMPQVVAGKGEIIIDNVTGPINFERTFWRWVANATEIGTEKGGGGNPRDFILKTDNVQRVLLDSLGNVVMGTAAINTTATDGFLYAVSGAGAPTGVPTSHVGRVPIYIDTTNSQLWLYIGGAWKQPKTPAGAALVTWQ